MPYDGSASASVLRLSETHVPGAVETSLADLLTQSPRKLHTSLSYDPDGSLLFEELCQQPEYYLTRTEVGLLRRESGAIVDAAKPDGIVDLGCGNFEKTQLLIHEAVKRRRPLTFNPVDIDEDIIVNSMPHLRHFYGDAVQTQALVGSFESCLGHFQPSDERRLFAFIGSTYGNLTELERASLLNALVKSMGDNDTFLLGVDLVKDPARLEAAYNDRAGCIERAMRRMLVNLNQQYGADFDINAFDHVSQYLPEHRRVVSFLIATRDQTVEIPKLDLTLNLQRGEKIEAEIREKFVIHQLLGDLLGHGLTPIRVMVDDERPYALILSRLTSEEEFGALSAAA